MPKSIRASLAASLALLAPLAAQGTAHRGSLAHRLNALLDAPPFDRATWGVSVLDERGRVLFERNARRLFVPASSTKLVVTAVASALLPPDYRVRTSLYANGELADGVLQGDLVLYGRGDPTFSERCYGVDTLAPGACDSTFTAMDALADSVRARGVRRITGRLVGDGSYFEPTLVHPAWNAWDLNWWYAAPVSGLGFHDNSVDFAIAPGDSIDAPPRITWTPDLALFTFENRARTVPAGGNTTIGDNFFRRPGTMDIWAEGTVATGRRPWIESFALPDPNYYAARALAAALRRRGIAVEGGAASTTDSLDYRAARRGLPLAEYRGRPLGDIIFPILNTSQNWFAEMLLKILGRETGGEGSWDAGVGAERRFLIDSLRLDSTEFSLQDGSGLAAGNLVSPHAFSQLLAYMIRSPNRAAFLAALPRAGGVGSLRTRFANTPLAGQVIAKTGSINRVNTLCGYVERPGKPPLVFAIEANAHAIPERAMVAQIDSLVVEIGRTR